MGTRKRRRGPLTRELALQVAMQLADADGLEGLSMRRLAQALGVEAMSLYHHVPGKDAILDGMVDLVFLEVELPRSDLPWKDALRRRMGSLRDALVRHPWALHILETRTTPGLATFAHHDAVIGCLRSGGFSVTLAAHAYAVLDAYVYGFVHTEVSLPFRSTEEAHEVAGGMMEAFPAGAYPHLAELAREHVMKPGYTFAAEFDWGLELILEGLGAQLAARPAG